MREFIGIDVSKDKLDLCWLRDADCGKKKQKVFKNHLADFGHIKNWLIKELKTEPKNIVVTLEPTNVYHEALCYYLHKAGFKVLLVNTGKAKQFAESINMTHKTDKLDAFVLERVDLWSPFVQLYIGSQTITKANDTILL